MVSVRPSISHFSNLITKRIDTFPRAPITIGIIVIFMFSKLYFSFCFLRFSFCCQTGRKSPLFDSFSSLFFGGGTTRSVLFVGIRCSFCTSKFQRIVASHSSFSQQLWLLSLSLDSEWQQVPSGLQDSFKYSSRS